MKTKTASIRLAKVAVSGILGILIILVILSCSSSNTIIPVVTTVPTTPVVATTDVNSITLNSVVVNANITSDGDAIIKERGICWNSGSGTYPTIMDNKISSGVGTGNFSVPITGLTTGTTYQARAYAINSVGTAYGSNLVFSTTRKEYTITVSPSVGGSIVPSGAFKAFAGDSVVFNFNPDSGYLLKSASVNGGVIIVINGKYTVRNISSDFKVEAVFVPIISWVGTKLVWYLDSVFMWVHDINGDPTSPMVWLKAKSTSTDSLCCYPNGDCYYFFEHSSTVYHYLKGVYTYDSTQNPPILTFLGDIFLVESVYTIPGSERLVLTKNNPVDGWFKQIWKVKNKPS